MTVAPAAWRRYGHASEVQHFAWFCRTMIRQITDPFVGMPLELEAWELAFMGEALAVDKLGRRIWRSVCLIVSRKNGKTALLAAYALYRLIYDPGNPEILLAAASDKNAKRLFDAVVGYIRANPELERLVHIREYEGEIVRVDGAGKIIRLATDPTVLHGYNPSLVICDELHAWTKPSLRKVWAALTTAGGARLSPQVFTITTAGEAAQRASSILGRMLNTNEKIGELEKTTPGLTISRNAAGEMLIYNYEAPGKNGRPLDDPHDLEAMKLANPASWITVDYLARQASNPELSAAEVLQFHGGVWAKGESTFVDPQVFAELADPRSLDEVKGYDVVFAFDGSDTRDSTVLIGATVEERPYVWVHAAWERPPDISPKENWRVPRNEVVAAIEDALDTFDCVEFAPDPPGWRREIEDLEEQYGEIVVRFETFQPRRMGPACDDFVQAVLGPGEDDDPAELEATGQRGEPELSHDGSEILMRHLANCQKVERNGYWVVAKEHRDSPRKIDAAVGAIVAYHRARWLFTNQEEDDLGAIVIDPTTKR